MNPDNYPLRPARPLARSPWAVAGTMAVLIAAFLVIREHCDLLAGRWIFLLR